MTNLSIQMIYQTLNSKNGREKVEIPIINAKNCAKTIIYLHIGYISCTTTLVENCSLCILTVAWCCVNIIM